MLYRPMSTTLNRRSYCLAVGGDHLACEQSKEQIIAECSFKLENYALLFHVI